MKLLAHLVAADVRRHRWLLATWLVVLVASTVLQGLRPALAAQPAAANTMALLTGLLMVIRLLLRVLTTALVVQTHPLVGSDAFWLTRPIPPLMLLLAKSIVLGVFLVLAPVAAEAALMSIYGVPPSQMVRVAIDSTVFAALWVALLAAAAALTPTLTRFALLCGGVLAALALYLAVQITISTMTTEQPPVVADPPRPENVTGAVVFVVLLTLACAITLIAQYRSRRLGRSVAIATVAVVTAVVATNLWQPLLQANVVLPAWAASQASLSIVAHAEAVRSDNRSADRLGRAEWRRAVAPVQISGLEPGWSADMSMLEASLRLDDGRTVTSVSSPYPEQLTTDFTTRTRISAISGLIGAPYTSSPAGGWPATGVLLVVPEAEFARIAPVVGRYRGRFHVQLTHHQIEAALPLRPGAEVRNGSYRVIVDSVAVSSRHLDLFLRESDAASYFDRRPRGQRTYYVRNRRSGTAFEVRVNDFDGLLLSRMIGGLSVSRSMFGFWADAIAIRIPPPWIDLDSPDAPDETWLRDADLIVVRSTNEGGVERTLDIDRFPLDRTAVNEARTEP